VRRTHAVALPERPRDHQREQQRCAGRRLQQDCVLDMNGREVHRVHQPRQHRSQSPQRKQHQSAQDSVQRTDGHPAQSSNDHRVWLAEHFSQPCERNE
jgi:hypothetical protein